MYRRITRSIEVTVTPTYLDDRSIPSDERYIWAYKVRIANQGGETVQLRMRHWRITDAIGHFEEVHDRGVVGQEPVLRPGDVFEYTSFSGFLPTPSGIMAGTYDMETENGEKFAVEIPAFSLDSPYQERRLH
jgi:ApaG protein